MRYRGVDAIVAFASVALLLALFAPSVAENIADSRRLTCLNRAKQICLSLSLSEVTFRKFPTASTAPITAQPGNGDQTPERAGYSWLTRLLPYLDQSALNNALIESSKRQTLSPFSDKVRLDEAQGGKLIATVPIDTFLCPGSPVREAVDVENTNYRLLEGGAPATTSYFAMSSTHLIPQDDGFFLSDDADTELQGNGGIPMVGPSAIRNDASKGMLNAPGITYDDLKDGASNTFMFCESREANYAAWIDGQVAWMVAAWPSNPESPQLAADSSGVESLQWNKRDGRNKICIAAQQVAEAQGDYLPADFWSGSHPRHYGPSGNHPGATMHGFADGHGKFVSNEIDRDVYLHLVTRDGKETIPESVSRKFISRQ